MEEEAPIVIVEEQMCNNNITDPTTNNYLDANKDATGLKVSTKETRERNRLAVSKTSPEYSKVHFTKGTMDYKELTKDGVTKGTSDGGIVVVKDTTVTLNLGRS